ncbi:MAG TPA: selenocysteine-specific translation elongation factor [Gemmatimonadales bacterium]|nr:selenocysteine-specific translation elongation factor [Gemmatimonadales bacterium]
MIVGTAGHVDHGKSALVEALTGRRMDRLAEERRRGLTIELNFAPLELGGAHAGVVDVPGHEDLVRTMAAGAAGMDVVLLVVAADEGIRPQTREHRAVLEALRVPRGIPVVTRADLAGRERAARVADDLAAWLESSVVAFEPPVVVSARTGEGIDALRTRLARLAAEPHGTTDPRADLFRLNVDRVFSSPGAGTVVTGSVVSGTLRVGDRVALLPGPTAARIRAVESFGRAVEEAVAGDRVGLALALQAGEAERGRVVVAAGAPWRETLALDVSLELEPGAVEPPHGARVRLLAGTTERLARLRRRADRPGKARLALESPMVARGGDRFVLRSYSPVRTLGGGVVLDPSPPSRAPWTPGLDSGNPADRLGALVARRPDGIVPDEVPVLLGVAPVAAREVIVAAGLVGHEGRLLDRVAVAAAREAVLAALDGAEPVALAALRTLPRQRRRALGAALARLVEDGALSIRDGRARRGVWPDQPSAAAAALAARVEESGFAAPGLADLGSDASAARLREAELAGLVLRVDQDRWLGAAAARRLQVLLQELAGTGEITPARLRERTGLSRKYLIPLLEWSDRQGWTLRRGEARTAGPRLA